MDVTTLAFNQLIGMRAGDTDGRYLVYLPNDPKYANHLGTIHASALLALAEAASGAFLAKNFSGDGQVVPVVRHIEAKFRKPAHGVVGAYAKTPDAEVASWLAEVDSRGRALVSVEIDVEDASQTLVLSATVQWFIVKA